MTSIIVEDEMIAAQRLLRMVNEVDSTIDNLHIFESIKETVEYLMQNPHPDILFLDIQVADGNTFELFKILEIKSRVIFTTAYSEHAVAAFRANAIDYLLKPINAEELAEAISKVKLKDQQEPISLPKSTEYKDRILIRFTSKLTVVKTSEIAYIFSENKIAYFYLATGQKVASDYKLQDLEELLDPKIFFRVNRQFIVNIDSVQSMSTYSKARVNLKLIPDFKDDIIVSTEKTPELKSWLRGK